MYSAQTTTPLNGVQSESIDAGSEGPPPCIIDSATPGRHDCRPKVRTYIVEDNAIILDNLTATLEELAAVQVIGSASGEATALCELNQLDGRVDLVIIDVFLSQGSGLGVLRNLAQGRLTAKRVVLTNYATSDMRDRCGTLGAHRVFDKSCDLDDLIAYCTRLSSPGEEPTPSAVG